MTRPTRFLPAREQQILTGLSHGRNNRQIGRELGISEDTVKTYVSRLLRTLDANDRAHLVRIGFERGLLAPSNGEAAS